MPMNLKLDLAQEDSDAIKQTISTKSLN